MNNSTNKELYNDSYNSTNKELYNDSYNKINECNRSDIDTVNNYIEFNNLEIDLDISDNDIVDSDLVLNNFHNNLDKNESDLENYDFDIFEFKNDILDIIDLTLHCNASIDQLSLLKTMMTAYNKYKLTLINNYNKDSDSDNDVLNDSDNDVLNDSDNDASNDSGNDVLNYSDNDVLNDSSSFLDINELEENTNVYETATLDGYITKKNNNTKADVMFSDINQDSFETNFASINLKNLQNKTIEYIPLSTKLDCSLNAKDNISKIDAPYSNIIFKNISDTDTECNIICEY